MKNIAILIIILFFSTSTKAQDALFAGLSLRFENRAIGINAGLKKEIANFGMGGLVEFSSYPHKKEENKNFDEFYRTHTGLVLGGYYNFYLPKQIIIYPIAGMAINTTRSKHRIENTVSTNANTEFSVSLTDFALGGVWGVGLVKKLGNINLIGNLRQEFSEYRSLKLFVGFAYKFGSSPNDK